MTTLALLYRGLIIAEAAAHGIAVAIEGRNLVRRLVAEGRDPTDEEWRKINALSDDLHARIQGGAAS